MSTPKKSNILIGTREICNLIKTYGDFLKKEGYNVTTVDSYNENIMFSDRYDVRLDRIGDFLIKSNFFLIQPLKILVSKLNNNFQFLFKPILTKKLIETHDIFIFIWGYTSLFFDNSDLEIIKRKKKKIVYLLMGSDVRFIEAFEQKYKINMSSQWSHSQNYRMSINENLTVLRRVETYSDVIFSVPDQSLLAVRNYYHLYLPISIDDYKFETSSRPVPNVLHCPSNPSKKGTNHILKIIKELKEEGYQFNFNYKTQIPHDEVKKSLQNTDILIDELNGLGPGMLSIEAMASNCVVLTRCIKSIIFNPPVIEITKDNLKSKLIDVLNMSNQNRKNIAQNGLEYVQFFHDIKANVRRIFTLLQNDTKPDYIPTFFANEFTYHKEKISIQLQDTAKEIIIANGVRSEKELNNLINKGYCSKFNYSEKKKVKFHIG